MPLTPEVKAERKRQRMIAKAKEYQLGTYSRKFVAPLFQKMVRAEAGAKPHSLEYAVVDVSIRRVVRFHGQCVCVTCGNAEAWDSGIKGMHTGHFLAGRRQSVVFEEDNVAPQCSHCNYFLSGAPQAFRKWMTAVRGRKTVERLERLATVSVSFTREELVDRRIEYSARLKAAEELMRGGDA